MIQVFANHLIEYIIRIYIYIYMYVCMSIGRGWLSHTRNYPSEYVYELGWDIVY